MDGKLKSLANPSIVRHKGPVPIKDMQIPLPSLPPPLHLRSDYLDIKNAQCAENKDGRKTPDHIISRLGAGIVQKRRFFLSVLGHFVLQK